MTDLGRDPRWRRMQDPAWTCTCCGQRHGGVFDIAYGHPVAWTGPSEPAPNSMIAQEEGDILTVDFCRLGPHRMVRCILPIPIRGAPAGERFAFGVWGSLSPGNFEAMLAAFDTGQGDLGPYFSWLSNRLPGAPDQPSRCRMEPRAGRQRPVLVLGDPDNPWTARQQDGISLDELLDTYATTGHDLRPGLGDA
ncbi:DUF2199 domain-containing protein [Halovulum dunhuangense]|uniref:DUF2199 domain-containing protein n=1 Tax=Halovulum dunhuangense TaxID=1505036 RepID=A0A849L6Y9_9RHOB|nr:DUF2199 domain-containing protein [Halovulum dunhuangense]NNU81880.1 DUF2199 domain-containing protein [Halovulum dunhuangense]